MSCLSIFVFHAMTAAAHTLLPDSNLVHHHHDVQMSRDLEWMKYWTPKSEKDVLTIKVEIGKAGSTTLKAALLKQKGRPGGYCVLDTKPCAHCATSYQTCNSSAILINGDYGDCDLVAPRKCQYLTIVREPVSRSVSEYSYYCLACEEDGKFCSKVATQHGQPSCPNNMSFLQWVGKYNLQYTRHFSRTWSVGDSYYNHYHEGFASDRNVNRSQAETAMRVLTGKMQYPFLAIKLEELDTCGWSRIDQFLGNPSFGLQKSEELKNDHTHSIVPTRAEQDEAERIQHLDRVIYQAIPSCVNVQGKDSKREAEPEVTGDQEQTFT